MSGIGNQWLLLRLGVLPELDEAPVVRGGAGTFTALLVDLRLPQLRWREVDQVGENSLTLRRIPAEGFLIPTQLAQQLCPKEALISTRPR